MSRDPVSQRNARVRLDSLAAIDPESLSQGTSPSFTFTYLDISSAYNGRLQLPEVPISYREAPSRARRRIRSGDVIMSTVRPNLKAFALCDLPTGEFVASTGFAVLRPISYGDGPFILFAILSDDVGRQIEAYTVGSNYPAINSSDVKRLLLPGFSDSDRRRIGRILLEVDQQITVTQDLVAKYKQIQSGLMHDLFTRGLNANGELRPLHEECPELYTESPHGMLPRTWVIRPLEEVADVIDPNPSHRNPIYVTDGFPFISTVEFIEQDAIQLSTPRRVAEATVMEQEARCRFSGLSIAFSRKGTIGEIRRLPSGIRFALLDSLCVINPSAAFDADYLFWSLRSSYLKKQIVNATMGVALQQLSIGRVRSLRVPSPNDDEQVAVGRILAAASDNIAREIQTVNKLRSIKQGLLGDLMTGRVQVKVDKLLSETANV